MLSSEKVAYLKGLADGLELGKDTKQDKLIGAIIEVLDTVAKDIEALNVMNDDLANEIDVISDDLADVEEVVFGDECCCCEDDDECCCDDESSEEHECCCGGHHEDEAEGHECCGGHGHHHDHDEADEDGHHCCGGHGHHHDHGEGGCGCGHHHGNLYDITCPGCNNHLTIDDHILSMGKVQCPHCGASLEFDLPEEAPEAAPEE